MDALDQGRNGFFCFAGLFLISVCGSKYCFILFYSSVISYFSHAYSLYSLSRCLSLVGLTPARYRKCMFRCNACLLAACFKFKRKEATCVPLCRLTQLTCTGSIFFSWIKYSRSCPAINNIFLIIDVATFSAAPQNPQPWISLCFSIWNISWYSHCPPYTKIWIINIKGLAAELFLKEQEVCGQGLKYLYFSLGNPTPFHILTQNRVLAYSHLVWILKPNDKM